jgi:UDP-N-acetylglucosamine 4-epimerase
MSELYHQNDLTKLRFLVTGGAGFIGSHIVEYLVKHNALMVTVVDNLSTGFAENIQHLKQFPNFTFIKEDVTNYDSMIEACKHVDIVFHQAALGSVPRSIENPLHTNDSNVTGQLNILWAAIQNKVKRVIYASSSSVYGDNQQIPKIEEIIGTPLSPYAISKRVNELYAQVFHQLYNLEVIGLRYFNVFGPRQNPKGPYAAAIPIFINALLNNSQPVIFGSGEQSRDFTYVDNIVQANIHAAFCKNAEALGSVLNIGAGGNTTINALFKMISSAIGSKIQPSYASPRKGDVMHSSASIEKAKEILDYKPTVKVEEGILHTIASFKKAVT